MNSMTLLDFFFVLFSIASLVFAVLIFIYLAFGAIPSLYQTFAFSFLFDAERFFDTRLGNVSRFVIIRHARATPRMQAVATSSFMKLVERLAFMAFCADFHVFFFDNNCLIKGQSPFIISATTLVSLIIDVENG